MNNPPDLPHLPTDLILQILARLPPKPLLRCLSLSKPFLHHLTSPHFLHLHHRLSSQSPNLLLPNLLLTISPTTSTSSLDFLPDRVHVRATSHGLLLCASVPTRGLYYICNPTTRLSRALPRARERDFSRFHPSYESTLVGLAYDPATCGFAVALAGFYRPFGHRPRDRLVCAVFDSVTSSWTKFTTSLYEEFTHMNRAQVVSSRGSLHWLTRAGTYVLALDLEELTWRKMSMPMSEEIGVRVYLLELEGDVAVVRISEEWMSVLVLEDYERERWELVERVSLRCIRGFAASAFPVGISREVVFLATQKKVLTYGRKDRVWREVYEAGDGCAYPLWFSAFSFAYSLFPCG